MSGILILDMDSFNNISEFETAKKSICQFTNNLKRKKFPDNN